MPAAKQKNEMQFTAKHANNNVHHLKRPELNQQEEDLLDLYAQLKDDLYESEKYITALQESLALSQAMYNNLANTIVSIQQQNLILNQTVASMREQIAYVSENTLGNLSGELPDLLKKQAN